MEAIRSSSFGPHHGGPEVAVATRARSAGPNASDDQLRHARHQAQCRICGHPRREAIEQDFLNWVRPRELVQTYNLASDRAIYRHAHAVGLIERRRANRLAALDRIIERACEGKPTDGAAVSAIRRTLEPSRPSGGLRPSFQQWILERPGAASPPVPVFGTWLRYGLKLAGRRAWRERFRWFRRGALALFRSILRRTS